MKRLLNKAIALALMATTWVGCSQEDYYLNSGQESESDIQISLNLNVPDPIQMTSRAVTEGINNFTVLCFDKNDKALVKEIATFSATGDESGTLTVTIPNATRVMHVFANQVDVPFVKGMREKDERLTNLVATPDQMIYWGRIEVPTDIASSPASVIKDWWANEEKSIELLRSHAKVEVYNNNTSEFTLLGYAVVNTKESGMAIPYYYNGENGAYPTVEEWLNADFIHAAGGGLVSGALQTEDQISNPTYIYETPVNTESPASIIIYGYNNTDPDNKRFWRVAFADALGHPYDIRRNHHFTVNIEGHILVKEGHESIEAALQNNPIGIKPDIDPEVTAIKNSKFSLTVENTSYILAAGTETSKDFNFTIKKLKGDSFYESKLKVYWEDGQDVCSLENFKYEKTADDGTTFTYKVTVPFKTFDIENDRQEGTLVINYDDRLERKVKFILIKQQLLTIESYNGVTEYTTEENGALLKFKVSGNKADYEKGDALQDHLTFSLPDDFPTELLPLNVLVSTTDFNVANSPLIFKGDGGYGNDNGIGYKYVCPVNEIGEGVTHTIDLRFINNLVAQEVELTLEAEFFKPVKLIIEYTFTESSGSKE